MTVDFENLFVLSLLMVLWKVFKALVRPMWWPTTLFQGEVVDEALLPFARLVRPVVVDGEGADDPGAASGPGRPAGTQLVSTGEVAEGAPARVGGDVHRDDGHAEVGSRATGARLPADDEAVDAVRVARGQRRRRPVAQRRGHRVEQQDGTAATGHEQFEGDRDLAERVARRDAFQHAGLPAQQRDAVVVVGSIVSVIADHDSTR